jgi:hypothetical protein
MGMLNPDVLRVLVSFFPVSHTKEENTVSKILPRERSNQAVDYGFLGLLTSSTRLL